jgi:hypothetical protein
MVEVQPDLHIVRGGGGDYKFNLPLSSNVWNGVKGRKLFVLPQCDLVTEEPTFISTGNLICESVL